MSKSAAVACSDSVVQSLQEALSASSAFFRETEASFLRDDLFVRERINVLDKLSTVIHEERRMLELQLMDSRNQAGHAKSKLGTVQEENKRIQATLSQPLAQLERDEKRLDEQHMAFKSKLQEVMGIASQLDERLAALQASEAQLELDESTAYNKERDYENAKREMIVLEQEVDNRRRSLERREESISSWMRALDVRDAELVRCQIQFKEELQRLEAEERSVKHQDPFMLGRQQQTLSQRAVMDDHGMTIDRDEESDEEDADAICSHSEE